MSPRIWGCGSSSCVLRLLYEEGLLPIEDPGVIDERLDLDGVDVGRLLAMPIGVALGDALGSTLEFAPLERKARLRLTLESFPRGSHITDDTQLTYWGLEVLLRRGWLDPELVAERYSRERIIGIGRTVREFLRRYKDQGLPWYHASVPSAGNGALMKLSPAPISAYINGGAAAAEALVYTIVVYRDPLALASAYATTRIILDLASDKLTLRDPDKLIEEYLKHHRRIEGDTYNYTLDTKRGRKKGPAWKLIEEALEEARQEGWTPLQLTRNIGSSGYLLETIIFTLYNITIGGTPYQILARAATQSQDSDTIAAITGMLLTAWKGKEALPGSLVTQLITRILPRKFLLIQKDLEQIIK